MKVIKIPREYKWNSNNSKFFQSYWMHYDDRIIDKSYDDYLEIH